MNAISFQKMKELVGQKTGLDLSSQERLKTFTKILQNKQKSLNLSEEELYLLLLSDPRELSEVIEALSVGETYFFRHAFQWEALGKWLQEASRQRKTPLTLWSAGCASGEEAYSLSILCKKLLLEFRILATDINEAFLAKARLGIYSSSAFRKETPIEIQQKYFHKYGEFSWQIREEYKQGVKFLPLNLADVLYPMEIYDIDVILCRNVMLYLKKDTIRHLMEKFAMALRSEGILLVSPCESMLVDATRFQRISGGSGHFYQKMTPSLNQKNSVAAAKPNQDTKDSTPATSKTAKFQALSHAFKEKNKPFHPRPPLSLSPSLSAPEHCKLLVDEGRYMEAVEYALLWSHEAFSLELSYYVAIAYENLKLYKNALEKHDLILAHQSDFLLSYFAKAGIYETLLEVQKARELYEKLRSLLIKLNPKSEVPLSDGIQVQSLLEILQKKLE